MAKYDKTKGDVILSHGGWAATVFRNLPQPTGICTTGSQRGYKQLAFSPTKLQGDSFE